MNDYDWLYGIYHVGYNFSTFLRLLSSKLWLFLWLQFWSWFPLPRYLWWVSFGRSIVFSNGIPIVDEVWRIIRKGKGLTFGLLPDCHSVFLARIKLAFYYSLCTQLVWYFIILHMVIFIFLCSYNIFCIPSCLRRDNLTNHIKKTVKMNGQI